MEKIDVSLYGGKSILGGKETKLEAVTLYCDKCENCSLYKEGKCLNIRSLLGASCKFGSRKREEGYTSRAQKYYSWKKKFTEDPMYNKLKYPNETYIAKIDNFIFINTGFIHRDRDTGKLFIETMLFNDGYVFISEEEFTDELLRRICATVPRALVDYSPIKRYQEKIVPNFLDQFKKLMPERFNQFVSAYPEFGNIMPNYVGKYAYVRSLRDGVILKDFKNNTLVKQGNKLICENYNSAFLPFDGKNAKLEMEIPEKAVYQIKDNNEVDENTLFRD